MDRIYADGSILNKQEAWADSSVNPKHYGVPATNVVKWRNPDLPGRKNIMVAVGKAHAKTLLCIGGSTMAELEAERTAPPILLALRSHEIVVIGIHDCGGDGGASGGGGGGDGGVIQHFGATQSAQAQVEDIGSSFR